MCIPMDLDVYDSWVVGRTWVLWVNTVVGTISDRWVLLVRSGPALARQRIAGHRCIYVYVEQGIKSSPNRREQRN